MAEEKITLATLRVQIAKQTGISEARVSAFLNELFPAIVSGLKEDGQVRIGNLGTLRLQWNEPRKSVNVQTGESMIIEGFNKVAFTPDADLREKVNEPYSDLVQQRINEDGSKEAIKPQIDENDPIRRLGAQAEEIKDIIAELNAVGQVEQTESEPQEPEPHESEPQKSEQQKPESQEPEPQESEPQEPEQEVELDTNNQEEPAPKKRRPWLIACIVLLLFCGLLVATYFILQDKIVSWAESLSNTPVTEQPIADANVGQDAAEVDDFIVGQDEDAELAGSQNDIATPAEPVQITLGERKYNKFQRTEVLTKGSRLAWLSRKYYGSPYFWVYIYEANMDRIADPNNLLIGTAIRIPVLDAELIDASNPEAIQKAEELKRQILNK